MPSTHIELKGDETRLAGQLRSAVDSFVRDLDRLAHLKAVMDSAASGSDWTGLRATFGFASDTDAETAYNLVTNLVGAFGAAVVTDLTSRMG